MSTISTTVVTHYGGAKFINWLPKGQLWVSNEHPSVLLDYEPWSCADRNQRAYMQAEVSSGLVELTLHVRDLQGNVTDIPYNPFRAAAGSSAGTVSGPSAASPASASTSRARPPVSQSHTITVGANSMASTLGLSAEVIKAPAAVQQPPQSSQGFTRTADHAPATTTEQLEAALNGPVSDRAGSAGASLDSSKARFQDLVAEKKYKEAYDVMVGYFGQDRITFNYRTVIALKDWDTIVDKYQLA